MKRMDKSEKRDNLLICIEKTAPESEIHSCLMLLQFTTL